MSPRAISVGLCLFLVCSLAIADTIIDDFKDKRFTEEMWEILQGDWEIKGGWWSGFSPAIGQGAFALFSDIETHDGLRLTVTEKHLDGVWANGYIIFAYVAEAEVYYAGSRIGRGNWTIEKSALAGGEQNFGEVADGRIGRAGVLPRYTVAIEGNDVAIYDDKDKEMNRHSFGEMPVGRIGLANENAETQYQDFEVEGPEVQGLSVEPGGKLTTTWGELKSKR